jgi:hypothetical protein
MTIEQPVHAKRDEIQRIAAKHGARNVRVFGSITRGEARNGSDIDFLLDTGPVTSRRAGLRCHLRAGREFATTTSNF